MVISHRTPGSRGEVHVEPFTPHHITPQTAAVHRRSDMPDRIPSFVAIAADSASHSGLGPPLDLAVMCLGSDQRLYVAATQNREGDWYTPDAETNPLAPLRHSFDAFAVGCSKAEVRQVIGIRDNERMNLAAWQDFLQWNVVGMEDDPLLPQQNAFSALAMARSGKGHLQLVGLRQDHRPMLAAWQDGDGRWQIKNEVFGRSGQAFAALTMARSSKGNLQVVGLQIDGRISLAAWQDDDGHWHIPQQDPLAGQTLPFMSIRLGHSSGNHLIQVIGLHDQKLCLAATQSHDGHWQAPPPLDPFENLTQRFAAFELGYGNGGRLQILGLSAASGTVHLAAWQDTDGDQWHIDGMQLSTRAYTALAAANGNGEQLQVLGLDTQGALRLAAWQDTSGVWHRGNGLPPEPHGPWNPKLPDVQAAFGKVGDHGKARLFHGEPWIPNMVESHIQGIARYGDFYVLTHNNKGYSRGRILVLSQRLGGLQQQFDSPIEHYNHPGGCQVIGDYLAMALENSDNNRGYVVFYDLRSMTHDIQPSLLPLRIDCPDSGVGGVGITNYTLPDGREHYLVAAVDAGEVSLYLSNDKTLDDPACAFRPVGERQRLSGGSTSHVNLVTDSSNSVYLIAFRDETNGSGSYNDYVDLYRLDTHDHQLKYLQTRHMYTDRPTSAGVHFRWSAGLQIVYGDALRFHASQRNFVGNRLDIDVFVGAGDD